jgi:hypothetical protein
VTYTRLLCIKKSGLLTIWYNNLVDEQTGQREHKEANRAADDAEEEPEEEAWAADVFRGGGEGEEG